MSYASLSTEANTDQTMSPSPMLVSTPFPKIGEASRKRKRRSDDRLYKKIRKLENEKKKTPVEKRVSSKKNISIFWNKKETHLHRIVKQINWWEGQELILEMLQKFKNRCFLPKLYLVRYGKSERRRKIVNKVFVQWQVARFCGSISLSIMLREGLILTEERNRKD